MTARHDHMVLVLLVSVAVTVAAVLLAGRPVPGHTPGVVVPATAPNAPAIPASVP